MTTTWTPSPTQQTLIVLTGVLSVLAAAAVLAVFTPSTVSGVQVFGIVTAVASGTAVLGGLALAATVSPSSAVPHFVLILAVIGLTVALALQHVWGGTEVTGIFGMVVGGGLAGAGVGTVQKANTAKMASAVATLAPLQGERISPGPPAVIPQVPVAEAPPVVP